MPRDIFSREVDFGGSFSADGAELVFDVGDNDGFNMITQSTNINYQQNISRVYEIGKRLYLVSGRTQGTMGISHLIGPKKIAPAFYKKFGDVCQAASNNMNFKFRSGCHEVGDVGETDKVSVNHAVLQGLAGSVNANDVMYGEQMSFMFLYMTRE